MCQARPDLITVFWESPPGPSQGVDLVRTVRGRVTPPRVPPASSLTQIETAAVLGCSLQTVNRYVRSGKLKDHQKHGISMIRLREIKRFLRVEEGRGGKQ